MQRNAFTSGLVQDSAAHILPNTAMSYALNAVVRNDKHKGYGVSSERGDKHILDTGGKIKGTTYIEEIDASVIFLEDGASSIYLFYHKTFDYVQVVSDTEFGCNWGFDKCELIYGEVKPHNACSDLMLYFSSDCTYYVVNLDEMLSPVRKAAAISCRKCDYFTVFDGVCRPYLAAAPIPYSGSMTPGGAVSFAVQLSDRDGNVSNWFSASNTVYLPTENNQPGEAAIGGARLSVYGLDINYSRIQVAVIKTSAGVTTVELLEPLAHSGGTFSYDYFGQKGIPANIATVTTITKTLVKGRDLLQHDGRMLYYNIKNEKNLNYQKYANGIGVDWVANRVSMEVNLKYSFPTFMRGEVYDFGIVWNYIDGTHSDVFHIPACGGGSGNSNSGGNVSPNIIGNSVSTTNDKDNTPFIGILPNDIQVNNVGGGSSPNYVAVNGSDYDTEDRHLRLRNPSNADNNPDSMEQATKDDIAAIDTDSQSMKGAAACLDQVGMPYCCGEGVGDEDLVICSSAADAFNADLDDYTNIIENQFEVLGQFGQDKPVDEVEVNQTTTLKEAAQYLIDNAVTEREYTERKRPEFRFNEGGGGGGIPTASLGVLNDPVPDPVFGYRFAADRNDPWSSPFLREDLTEGNFFEAGSGATRPITTNVPYPDTKDCDGNRMYPEGNVCHHQMPFVYEVPHFLGAINGVQSKHSPSRYEYEGEVQLLGIRVKNITFPSDEELPKPLCPNNPYTIVYVPRDRANKSVLAAGWTSGMFSGEIHGKQYAFPRHGVNSFEHVDRYITPASDPKSRMGTQDTSSGLMTFHSPDTDLAQPYLAATSYRSGTQLRGSGWRHGLYAIGLPPTDVEAGSRKDQRGARVSNNLNHHNTLGDSGEDYPIRAITYAKSETTIPAADGFSKPLMNRSRESAVYLETEGVVQGNELDSSFVGDVMDHEAPTKCNANYGYLVRDIPNQYGSIEGRAYISTGLNGFANSTVVSGIAGDVFIVPYSKRRTSYVSNKIGNDFHPRPKNYGGPCPGPKTVCDTGEDRIFQFLGFNENALQLPESGDLSDPKNYCGLHTYAGPCGALGSSRRAAQAFEFGYSENDFYYPGTLKSLVHCVVESEVNAWHRATGAGDQTKTGQVYYPNLKNLYLDSSAPDEHPWEESYLNRYYIPVNQPSRSQIVRMAAIQNALKLLFPAAMLSELTDIESIVEAVGTMFTSSAMSAMWMLAVHTLFTAERVRNLFGIEGCITDDEGGDLRTKAEGFEDNYNYYNYDYSTKTTFPTYYAPTSLYNTCDCDDCYEDTNLEIYYSNKQILDSEIDAYQNVGLNQYVELPPHAGILQRLFVQQNNVYAHTSKGIWLIQFGVGNIPSDIGSLLTGDGQMLISPMMLLDSGATTEGFGGTRSPNVAINVPGVGYFFIDEKAGRIYRFNGQAEEISKYGNELFFREHLPFCEDHDCIDENEGGRYVMSYDYANDRLLVTKNDGDASFTISFTQLGADGRPQWISFHSYIPDLSFWDRRSLFLIKDNEIYLAGGGDKYLHFFGDKYNHIIQGTFVNQVVKYFDLKKVSIASVVIGDGGELIPTTFDKAAFVTGFMSTGLRPLVPVLPSDRTNNSQSLLSRENLSVIPAYFRYEEWDITRIIDLLDKGCSTAPLMFKEECNVHPQINDGITCLPQSTQQYANRSFGGRYVIYHLIYEGEEEIITNYIDWEEETPSHKQQS